MSQLVEADRLLMQWARWSSEEVRMLDYVCPRWQSYYDSGYQEESTKSSIPEGSDEEMQRVDSALARVRSGNPNHFNVIAYVYRRDAAAEISRHKLDAALRAFISEYWAEESEPIRAEG